MEGEGPILQLATRGPSRCFGFTFGVLSCRPLFVQSVGMMRKAWHVLIVLFNFTVITFFICFIYKMQLTIWIHSVQTPDKRLTVDGWMHGWYACVAVVSTPRALCLCMQQRSSCKHCQSFPDRVDPSPRNEHAISDFSQARPLPATPNKNIFIVRQHVFICMYIYTACMHTTRYVLLWYIWNIPTSPKAGKEFKNLLLRK